MAFRASSGRIRVTDAADAITVFDTQEGLFQATDFKSGQITIPQRVATWNHTSGVFTDVNNNIDHALASVNAVADMVVGGFSVSVASPTGVSGLGWFNAGGTYMHTQHWLPFLLGSASENRVLGSIATYTFRCSGGALVLNERVYLMAPPNFAGVDSSLTLLAGTFSYKLYCGKFV